METGGRWPRQYSAIAPRALWASCSHERAENTHRLVQVPGEDTRRGPGQSRSLGRSARLQTDKGSFARRRLRPKGLRLRPLRLLATRLRQRPAMTPERSAVRRGVRHLEVSDTV